MGAQKGGPKNYGNFADVLRYCFSSIAAFDFISGIISSKASTASSFFLGATWKGLTYSINVGIVLQDWRNHGHHTAASSWIRYCTRRRSLEKRRSRAAEPGSSARIFQACRRLGLA